LPLLGIIACQSLELEFANLLGNDPDLSSVYVLKNPYSKGFLEAIEKRKSGLTKTIGQIGPVSSKEELAVVFYCMKVGLHSVIAHLREKVKEAAMEMSPFVDAILLGYGLCGNALANPEHLLATDLPIFLPMDEDHPVDDCVGLLIGGRETYYREQCRCAGTMFWTPGFANHWKDLFREGEEGGYSPAMMNRLMKDYERVLLLPTPVMKEEEMRSSATEFSDRFGLRIERGSGSLVILEEAWLEMKKIFRHF
jgi:hypothetical protein